MQNSDIDITNAMRSIVTALRTFTNWMQHTTITSNGATVSIFDIVITALAVYIILDAFIPWGGDDD